MTIISSGLRRTGARLAAFVALTAVLSAGLVGVSPASAAPAGVPIDTAPLVVQVQERSRAAVAIAGTSFDPGYIISDWSFYNANGMTQAQIQSFLDAKCTTNNCIDNQKMTTTARAATNMCPSPYAAASNETFAAIIYKVQRSCGISAKVILVTLQKEQGLLTLQNPSALKLRKAMGMGCPDTSVCDSKYYGFFNQVYYAASQLKRYGLRTSDNISFRTKYQIGVPYATSYHPSASCGTKPVTVKTQATTALYYYTPYTPNAKALANLSGTGDKCSSYGNRNFWVYYNSWFGSSLAGRGNDAITAAYETLGGAGGVLGVAGATPNCATASTCSQTFAHGLIYWTLASGAVPVSGAIGDLYLAGGGLKGALGVPLTAQAAITDPVRGNGASQRFSGGTAYASAAGAFPVKTTIAAAYTAAGGPTGALGWPTASVGCTVGSSACSQQFTVGTIVAPKAGVAQMMTSAIYTFHQARGGDTGSLGRPAGIGITVTDKKSGNGFTQSFDGGVVHSSAAGTFVVTFAMMKAYSAGGWLRGALGWPIADQVCTADACTQTFAGGVIRLPASGTGYVVSPVTNTKIKAYYTAMGEAAGVLGYAKAGAIAVSDKKNGNGFTQSFDGGVVHSSAAGTFVVTFAMMKAYSAGGWLRGALGWPIADQVCTADACTQTFAGGVIRLPASGTGYVVSPVTNTKIKAYYTAMGEAAGVLGYAKAGAIAVSDKKNGNGFTQSFDGGVVHSSVSGTFLVTGPMMTNYSAVGWLRGTYGWPVADQVCAGGTCSQEFAGGSLSVTP
ncbi:MAG: LGFP repeat-containing protein [Microbacteriaceae bacterium]